MAKSRNSEIASGGPGQSVRNTRNPYWISTSEIFTITLHRTNDMMVRQFSVCPQGFSVLLALALCTSCYSNPPATYLLPSGREVNVYFADVMEDQWHLVYRTQLRLTDEFVWAHMHLPDPAYPESWYAPMPNHLLPQHYALQCEADGLQQDVQDGAEKAGVNRAVILPTSTHWEFERFDGWYPFFSVGRSVEFTLEQNDRGVWKKTVGWIEGKCGPEEAAEQGAEPDERPEGR